MAKRKAGERKLGAKKAKITKAKVDIVDSKGKKIGSLGVRKIIILNARLGVGVLSNGFFVDKRKGRWTYPER